MNFTFAHNNLNVFDLDRSLSFYKEALGLTETRRKDAEDGSFTLSETAQRRTFWNSHGSETWIARMNSETMRSISHLRSMILTLPLRNTKRWDVSASRIRQWEFISSKILTDTGWRSYLRNNPYTIQVCDQISTINKSKTAASRISRSRKRLSLLYFAKSSVL